MERDQETRLERKTGDIKSSLENRLFVLEECFLPFVVLVVSPNPKLTKTPQTPLFSMIWLLLALFSFSQGRRDFDKTQQENRTISAIKLLIFH